MQNNNPIEMFFALLRCGIDKSNVFPYSPTPEEWKEIFDISQKQALAGIAFTGVERLKKEQRPPVNILLAWHSICQKIVAYNNKLNGLACRITQKFKEEGFDSVILKGQGIAQLYAQPERRAAGDIDIWLDGGHEKIIKYIRQFVNRSKCRPVYHHVDFLPIDGVETEVHFTPTWMNCYFTNKKLQRFFEREKAGQFANKKSIAECKGYINTPTNAFNRIYILLHIYRHLFQEGIGLRQLLDYYYVLKQGFTEEEKAATISTLKELKMIRFTGAVMYVLKEVFDIEKKHMLTAPLEKDGKFLLGEIMEAGNFGKYSSNYSNYMSSSIFKRAASKTMQDFKFLTSYTSETIWGPIFRTWHYFYKKKLKSMVNEK